jgi:hypothetical protein
LLSPQGCGTISLPRGRRSDVPFGNDRAGARSTFPGNSRRESRRSYQCANALRAGGEVGSGDAVRSDIAHNEPRKPSGSIVHSSPAPAAYPYAHGVRPSNSGSRTVFHTGGDRVFANPVRREVTRHVRFHGGVLALPALVTLGVPVLLDVPSLGEVSVSEETYRALYPLLASDDEADRERAYVRLQEQIELRRTAHEIPAGRPVVDSCPECPDTAEKFPICQPADCDLAEVVFSKSHDQRGSVREKRVLPLW